MLVAVRATVQLNTIETSSMENESEAKIRMHNNFFPDYLRLFTHPEKTRSKHKSEFKASLENNFIELRSCLRVRNLDHRQLLFRIIFATGGQDAEAVGWNQC